MQVDDEVMRVPEQEQDKVQEPSSSSSGHQEKRKEHWIEEQLQTADTNDSAQWSSRLHDLQRIVRGDDVDIRSQGDVCAGPPLGRDAERDGRGRRPGLQRAEGAPRVPRGPRRRRDDVALRPPALG